MRRFESCRPSQHNLRFIFLQVSLDFDWLSAMHKERRTLYRHVKPLVDRRFGGNWTRCYADIPGHVAPGGHGDQDNFRAGRIARKCAAAIFDWIEAHYPAEAEAIAAALGAGDGSSSTWDDFLQRNGIYGQLHIARLDDASLNIVAFATRTRVERIRPGQGFCFALDSAGTTLALQAVDGRWVSVTFAGGGHHRTCCGEPTIPAARPRHG